MGTILQILALPAGGIALALMRGNWSDSLIALLCRAADLIREPESVRRGPGTDVGVRRGGNHVGREHPCRAATRRRSIRVWIPGLDDKR